MRSRFCRSGARPSLEVLEGRECPTVTASLADGVLTVVGDASPNQVSVVELAGAVVKINAVGEQFPLFAGVESIVVQMLGGDDRVEYGPGGSRVAMGDPSVRLLEIDVGAGDDVVIVRDNEPDPAPAADMQLFFQGKLSLGTGGDFVRVEVNHGSDVGVEVSSADGGDDIGVVLGPPARQKWSQIELKRGVDVELGAGGNRVSLAISNGDDVELNAQTSDGAGTEPPGPRDLHRVRLFSEGVPTTLPGQTADRPIVTGRLYNKAGVRVELGNADDRVTIDSRGFAEVSTDVDTGGGNDWVSVQGKYLTVRPRPDDPPTHLALDACLGDGDDRLTARFAGYPDAQLSLDFGPGDDRGQAKMLFAWLVEDLDQRVKVNAQLGAGGDEFRLFTRGYDHVRAGLDTGPDGDGTDLVAITAVSPGPRRNRITLLSMDMDRVHVLGIGYPTADIHRMGSTYQVSLIQDV